MGRAVDTAELAAWLKARDGFAVMAHIFPDGDAAGSCIAAALALKAIGKRAYVTLPGGMPKMYGMFEGADLVISDTDEPPFEAENVLVLDVTPGERLGERNAALAARLPVAVLDHHLLTGCDAELWHIDSTAAATGELVLELVHALGAEVSSVAALWLYIAICTDCGQFGYSNTGARTMRAAAELIEAGVDVADTIRKLYHTRSYARVQLMGRVLGASRLECDGRLCYGMLPRTLLAETGALPEDSDSLSSELLSVETAEVSFLAQERADGMIKFSIRSKEWVNVAQDIARPLGGGGHARAAGCTLAGPMEAAVDTVRSRIAEILAQR